MDLSAQSSIEAIRSLATTGHQEGFPGPFLDLASTLPRPFLDLERPWMPEQIRDTPSAQHDPVSLSLPPPSHHFPAAHARGLGATHRAGSGSARRRSRSTCPTCSGTLCTTGTPTQSTCATCAATSAASASTSCAALPSPPPPSCCRWSPRPVLRDVSETIQTPEELPRHLRDT